MVDSAKHTFLPWVQPGVVADLSDQAIDRLVPSQPAAISLPVKLVVNTTAVEKTVRLYGPGEVTAIDPQQVIRLEPKHLTTDFEPNYFPAIEFDRPDFPWLFTPAKADSLNRLRPWLCLVVVRKQEGVELRPADTLPLAVLEIKDPARPGDELPDLSESHFWAHAQVTGALPGQLQAALDSSPAQTASRLLCPRRLDPLTEYFACVVPAFEVGRKAGLNEPTDATSLAPAWLSGSQAPNEIILPVYFSWEFRTAAGGDFEELVRRLEPRELPPQVGKRPMDISSPGFPLKPAPPPDAEGTIIGLEGALRIVDSESDPWPDSVRDPFQAALAEIINTPGAVATNSGSDQDPILAPPIYGCWQAASRRIEPRPPPSPPADSPAAWLNELNLDPRNRAVAAMGTQVIQRQQEALMASAWAQLGDIQKINQRLRQAQLSRSVNEKYHAKIFNLLSDDALARIVAPAQSRLLVPGDLPNQPAQLLVQRLARSPVPVTAVSAPVRKLARPRGAFNRQFSREGIIGQGFFSFFNIRAPDGFVSPDRGEVVIDAVSQALAGAIAHEIVRDHRPPFVEFFDRFTVLEPGTNRRDPASPGIAGLPGLFSLASLNASAVSQRQPAPNTSPEFVAAVHAHQEYLTGLFTTMIFVRPFAAIVTRDLKAAVLTSLEPGQTVSRQARADLEIKSAPLLSGDELDPIMDAPVFPQPMYEALRDLSQDYLFPGLEHVLPNSIQLLETNGKFIESFMVGLNTEMGRELLWRNYPTDQRGTYFLRFWGAVEADGVTPVDDITPIHEWKQRELGTFAAAGGDKLVLLIRGELLRRYPGTIIYAVKAVVIDGRRELATDHPELNFDPGTKIESHPIFRGSLEPDVTFVGFDLAPAEVIKDDGWFFILQQQPTEPRFGLDDADFSDGEKIPELKTWNDLNWAHLAPTAQELEKLSHVPVKTTQLLPADPDKGIWGRNAAHMAYITKQLPVRIAIHATEFLPG